MDVPVFSAGSAVTINQNVTNTTVYIPDDTYYDYNDTSYQLYDETNFTENTQTLVPILTTEKFEVPNFVGNIIDGLNETVSNITITDPDESADVVQTLNLKTWIYIFVLVAIIFGIWCIIVLD